MLGIVAIFAIVLVMAIAMLPVVQDVDSQSSQLNNQFHTEQAITQQQSNVKVLPKKVEPMPVTKKEPVQVVIKEVAPQINNYNFESLSNVLLVVLSMIGGFFSCKYLFKFFNYLRTTYKFKKNEKKTNKLIASLKETIENQKEFLAIADRIEHQLKINDILLRSEESKKYGLNLEVADDYLHYSYTFANDNLIISLQ